jgi:Tol biopolymer transport system component
VRTKVLAAGASVACLLICGAASAASAEPAALDTCGNAGMRAAEQAAFLPDCRAYEMISPQDKAGGDISASSSRTRAALSGNAVQFVSMTGFGDLFGTDSVGAEYVSTRGSSGWATHGITPPQQPPAFPAWRNRYQGDFSDDLGTGIYFALSSVTNEDPNVAQLRNLYLRRDLLTPGPGSYQLLTGCPACSSPLAPLAPSQLLEDPALAGRSDDFRHVIFESPVRLTSDAPDDQPPGCAFDAELCLPYLYEAVDGHVRLAGILPDGTPAPFSAAGLGALNGDGQGTAQYTPNTISADGSRIVFTAGPFTDPVASLGVPVVGHMGDLYMRIDGSETIKLNASERDPTNPDPNGPQPAMYGGASHDDSKVFFMSTELLTDDAIRGLNLYMYDLNASAGHHLTLITQDNNAADDATAAFRAEYVVGTSDDGSYVYFWGANKLLPEQGPGTATAPMLYGWHDGELRFIGLNAGPTEFPVNWGDLGTVNPRLSDLTRVSPDGRHIAFATRSFATAQSVGYDNRNPDCQTGVCVEVYLYSYDTGQLKCVSCDPSGAPPIDDASFMSNSDDTTLLTMTRHLTHALSDDGQRLFFDTPDPLVPRDTNGKRDVYEYDAATGQVSLISTGRSSSDSLFAEATPSGNDVFFTTRQSLVGIDNDAAVDLYDARVGGGIAAQNPPPIVPCTGEGCRLGASPPPPDMVVLGGVSFQGTPGTPTATRVRGRIRLVHKGAHGSVLVLTVRVPAAGRITLRGSSVRPVSRSVSHAGTFRLRVRLTPRARRSLRHRHVLRVRVRVSYRPVGGSVSSVPVSFLVKA